MLRGGGRARAAPAPVGGRHRPAARSSMRTDHLLTLVDDVGHRAARATASSRTAQSGYCVDDVARLAVVALELARRGDEQVWTSILYRSLAFLAGRDRRRGRHAELHGLRPPLARRAAPRRPRRPLGLGARRDPRDRLGTRRRRPDASGCSTRSSHASRPDASLRTGAYAALGLAHLDPDRLDLAARASCSSGCVEQLAAGVRAHTRATGWRWFEDELDLRQRPTAARADRRRRRARPRRSDRDRASTSLRWLGDESGLAEGTLRLTGHGGRHRTEPAPGRRRRAAARRRPRFVEAELAAFAVTGDPEHGVRAQRLVRLVPRAQPAPTGRCTTSRPAAAATGSARRRRTTTRAPSRRSPSTALRCCSTPPASAPSCASARARPTAA